MADLLIRGVGAPIGVAVILLAILAQPWRRANVKPRAWAAGIAVAAAFATGFAALFGWPKIPPTESWQWLPLLTVVVTIVAVPLAGASVRWSLRLLIMLAVSALSAWLILPEFVKEYRGLLIAAIGAFVFADWSAMQLGARRMHSVLAVTLMMIFAIAASILLARHAGNAKLGQLAGAVAAPLGVCMVVAIWRRPAVIAVTLAAPVAMVHVGLIASAFFNHYSQTPNVSFALIAAAPLCFVAPMIPGVSNLKPAPRVLLVLAPCIALLTIGLVLAEKAYSASAYDY